MENRIISAVAAVFASLAVCWMFDLDLRRGFFLIVGLYVYLRIGDRLDALTIAVESLQDAVRRIEERNHTVPSKTYGDQNENVSIAGNRHFTEHQQ